MIDMDMHNPIDVLNNGRLKLVEERTSIELELKKIQEQITELDHAIGEYDYLIGKAKTIHEPGQGQKELPEFKFVESEKKAIAPGKCTTKLDDMTYG